MEPTQPHPADDADKPARSASRQNLVFAALMLAALVAIIGFVSRPAKPPPSWDVPFEAAKARAAQEHKLLVIDFGATWCPACKLMASNVLPDPRVVEALRDVVTVSVDVDARDDVAAAYQVESLPTFVVVNPAGRELLRFTGYRSVDDFIAEIAKARAAHGQTVGGA